MRKLLPALPLTVAPVPQLTFPPVELEHVAASVGVGFRDVEVERAGGTIVAIHAARALVNREHRDTLALDQLADVHGIAMADPGGALQSAVAADGRRAGDDLLGSVAVDVRGHGRMVALARGLAVTRAVAVEGPDLRQGYVAPVVGGHGQARVVPALLDDARSPSRGLAAARVADECDAAVEAIHAVAVGIAPARYRATRNRVAHGRQLLARRPVEHRQVFGAGQDVAIRIGVLDAVVVAGGRPRVQIGASSVLRARRRLARHLGLAVAVEVVHRELRVVRTRPNIRPEIDAPQVLARQGVPVQEDIRSDA